LRKTTVLRRALEGDGPVRVVGANDAVTALLAERHRFDALWASGLGISTAHGIPDTSILTMTELLDAAMVMERASSLPVIADCDTGFGGIDNVVRMVRLYERAGIAAVCIEDKQFPKRNSFLEGHELADPEEFAARVAAAKEAQSDPDFVVIARLESFIAGAGLDDALARASDYAEAGADAILVHSKAETPDEVIAFARRWRLLDRTPLVAVPTTYYRASARALAAAGFRVVIYANQALRATISAVDSALESLAENDSSADLEHRVASIQDVFDLVRGSGFGAERLVAR
jgi:phosphoenolpyruvate phosphomutase